ncbi:MAG: SDR family NAD(P)-dependent oxidoreductase, partial [Dongiaceae bacterium]
VRSAAIDATDRDAMGAWLDEVDGARPVDLLIANAGISAGTGGDAGESAEQARRIFAVNLDGVLNSVLPVLPQLRRRRRGQIALMSSLAAFRGFPGAPAYCASKAAVRVWGEALRGELHADGIEVSVICPGFVVSRMTDANRFRMPLLMRTDKAAAVIARGLARNRARIAFPLPMYVGSWLLGALPPWLTDPVMRRLPKKA